MPLVIPDEVLETAQVSGEELQRELAVLLFSQNRLTLAQAARFAGLDRIEFQRLLASRELPVHYTEDDFEHDLQTLRRLGQL